MSRNSFYPNLLIRKNAGAAELKAVFKWVKVTGQCLHRRSGWVIWLSLQPAPPWSMRCSLANGEFSKRNQEISKLIGATVGCLLAGAGSAPFGFLLSFFCWCVPVRSEELRETGSKAAACQLVWEVQLGKGQQQILCRADTESCFTEWFCSPVVLTPHTDVFAWWVSPCLLRWLVSLSLRARKRWLFACLYRKVPFGVFV